MNYQRTVKIRFQGIMNNAAAQVMSTAVRSAIGGSEAAEIRAEMAGMQRELEAARQENQMLQLELQRGLQQLPYARQPQTGGA